MGQGASNAAVGSAPRRVRVDLASRSYDVVIGRGVLADAGAASRGRTFLVYDAALPAALVDRVRASLGEGRLGEFAIIASEEDKSLVTLERILGAIADARLERPDTVVALGGGVVSDVAGFAAAVYRRGTALLACPTTLLSMVDASVGGKTGVNLVAGGRLLKNMAGVFHQPRGVLADVSALDSLDEREFACGLAECVKHAMLGGEALDEGLWDWSRERLPEIRRARQEHGPALDGGRDVALIELIARNVAVKARIVGSDEREEASDGGRALLNLGHTFAHAIETIPGVHPEGFPALPPPVRHGEAVAIGLAAASRLSLRLGLIDRAYAAEVVEALAASGLSARALGLPRTEEILGRMRSDKKVQGGRHRLVLPCGRGRARIVEDPDEALVSRTIEEMGAG